MRKSLITLAAVSTLAGPACAADIVTKAPPAGVFTGYPYAGNGLYAGVGAVAAILSADISSVSGTNSVYSAGAALDITAGYQWTGYGTWFAAEASVQYTNLGGSVTCTGGAPCSIGSKWGFEERALMGFPIDLAAGLLPNFNTIFPGLPQMPAGVVTTTSHPYIYLGLRQDVDLASYGLSSVQVTKIQPVLGLGLRNQWKAGLVVDVSAGCTFANTGLTIGGPAGAAATYGRDCRSKASVLF